MREPRAFLVSFNLDHTQVLHPTCRYVVRHTRLRHFLLVRWLLSTTPPPGPPPPDGRAPPLPLSGGPTLGLRGTGLRPPAPAPPFPSVLTLDSSILRAASWACSCAGPPITLFFTSLHRLANWNAEAVSEALKLAGDAQMSMSVLELPPRESLMSMVSGWLRYGQCFDPLVRALITSPIALEQEEGSEGVRARVTLRARVGMNV